MSCSSQPMDVVPKSQPSVDEAQWEEKVKAYHLPRAEINKVNSQLRAQVPNKSTHVYVSHLFVGCDGVSRERRL